MAMTAHREGTKIARGTRDCPNIAPALDCIDGVDVVGIYDASTTYATHKLRGDVRGNLTPREIAQRSKGKRYGRINVAA